MKFKINLKILRLKLLFLSIRRMTRFVKNVVFLSILLPVFIINSCNIINPAEEIPSYITINSIEFQQTDPSHGSPSQKITDAWVYIDEQLIGAFELPVTLPVLMHGTRKVSIRGGIKINGISATRAFYPFFEGYLETVELSPKGISVISPVVKYNPQTTFEWMSDFENEIKIESLPDSKTDLKRITDKNVIDPSLNGFACGGIILDESTPLYTGSSLIDFPLNLPKAGRTVFLEMNYKNNQEFSVGIIARNPLGDQAMRILTLNASENWNKIYINLTTAISENVDAKGYYFYLFGEKKEEVSKAEIYLDNLKILY